MEIRTNEPMARHTSFRVGGPADRFVIPNQRQNSARRSWTVKSQDGPGT